MDLPTLISRTSRFPILGMLGSIFHFIQISKEHSVSSEDPDQASHYALSDLDLHCLSDARLIWVKNLT